MTSLFPPRKSRRPFSRSGNPINFLQCIGLAGILLTGLFVACDGPLNPFSKGPVLSVSVSELEFSTATDSRSFNIYNLGSGTLFWRASTGDSWMSLSPRQGKIAEGQAPVQVTVTVDRSGLTGPYHNGFINVSGNDNNNATLQVTLQVLQPPAVPGGLSVSRDSESHVKIDWSPSTRADGYYVYRAPSGGSYTRIASTSATVWYDTDASPAQWYYYKVSAYASDSGESARSAGVTGFRAGWRFDEIRNYYPGDGVGFYYDLLAFGFKDVTRTRSTYAVYQKNGTYYHLPGSGALGKVAVLINHTSPYETSLWDNATTSLRYDLWPPEWRNNNYPQYIKMRIYKSANVTSLNDPYYDQTDYYSITWSNDAQGRPVPRIGEKLSREESARIDALLGENAGQAGGSPAAKLPVEAADPSVLRELVPEIHYLQ